MSRVISAGQIEKELSRLYEEKGEPCRASLFNFVVWAPSPERADYLRQLVNTVTEKFPCRLIFITRVEKASVSLEIEVAVDLRPNVACDLINLSVPNHETSKLPYVILPQLLPDLPIYLLWGQDPTLKSDLYDTLFPYASRIIFDSVCTKNLKAFARTILEHPEKKLRDINWSLLSGWRKVVARVIDSHEKLLAMQKATSIDIIYKEGPEVKALFFQAWLLSKLPHTSARFNLTPMPGEGLEGDILGLDIDSPLYEFSLTRKGDHVLIHVGTCDNCELPQALTLTHIQRGFNFWREVLFEPNSPDYLAMLKKLT